MNKLESGSSVYVMKDDFAAKLAPTASRDRLFLPWYLGYRSSRNASQEIAQVFQEELSKALPGWKFPLRNGPIAVLASATMPSVAIEIGNLNNPVNTQTLLDPHFSRGSPPRSRLQSNDSRVRSKVCRVISKSV